MKPNLTLILSIVLGMLALPFLCTSCTGPALTKAGASCSCGGKAKCQKCCGDKCSNCSKECCATKAPAKAAASCNCGGKDKCKKCCGDKCSDCCKDCCKSK